MTLHFHKLKLTLHTKSGITYSVPTRYAKVNERVHELLERAGKNVKDIQLEDNHSTIEIIGTNKQEE